MSEQSPVQQIGNLVRYWVHYDNTITTLNKQTKAARDMRTTYETQILDSLKTSNIVDPVIQIGDGRLIVSADKHTAPLTFTSLDSLLHQYYGKKPGSKDETADILKFIKENRETTVTPCLKRQASRVRSRSKE